MNSLWFLFSAYLIIWIGIWGYTVHLGRKLKRLSIELEQVKTVLSARSSTDEAQR